MGAIFYFILQIYKLMLSLMKKPAQGAEVDSKEVVEASEAQAGSGLLSLCRPCHVFGSTVFVDLRARRT